MLIASQVNNLLNNYSLSDIIIIGVGLFLIYKEVKKNVVEAKKEKKDENEAYHIQQSQLEDHDASVENRLTNLEDKVKKDYERIQKSESHLYQLSESMKELDKTVIDMRIESMRTTILDAVPMCIDLNKKVSAEKMRSLFKIYTDYEKLLADNNRENGEVDLAYRLLRRSYSTRLSTGNFTEMSYLPPKEAKDKIRKTADAIPGFWEDDNKDDYDNLEKLGELYIPPAKETKEKENETK